MANKLRGFTEKVVKDLANQFCARRCIECGEVIDSECLTTCKKCIEGGALEKGLTPNGAEAT